MTPADRPSVTDNARAETTAATLVARRGGKTQALIESLLAQAKDRGLTVEVVYPETTTATTEDAAQVVAGVLIRRTPGEGVDLAERIVQALAARGLLATARTRPTREQIAKMLARHDGKPVATTTDAVLALWADQPTEAEAGARALVHAAGDHFHAMVAAGAGNPGEVSTWLRERAARLRGGAR